mmetsp:Transcript_24281/g.58498  ORF Transcript_24281/g.58498 Transcript_24281/m.58498 type:complete len:217 (+) Transcript_24281:1274-1924(+)
MAGAAGAHVPHARQHIAVELHASSDTLEHRLQQQPACLAASRHEARAVPRAMLAARQAAAEVHDARGLEPPLPRLGVLVPLVAEVDDHVLGAEHGEQSADRPLHRLAGGDEEHDAPREGEAGHEGLERGERLHGQRALLLGELSHRSDLGLIEVEARDRLIELLREVEDQLRAHHAKTHHSACRTTHWGSAEGHTAHESPIVGREGEGAGLGGCGA